eukprot:TRINITY_DN264_c0_g1_i10.p1 TRINITY_DN264_c0_g1~~TRINITY_DN264_c0_g1_i10.p1  ORF type:complete len:1990 (+),score=845.48 TRINITY_DN264_c0_g1_i10:125-5971(+)
MDASGGRVSPTHKLHGQDAHDIDLSSYALKHRGWTHFKLALNKNLRLKTRKPTGLACELLLPPFFICCLMIGYFASDNTDYPSMEYASDPALDLDTATQDVFCTWGLPAEKAALPQYQKCVFPCFGTPLIPNMRNGQPGSLCINPLAPHAWKIASELYDDIINTTSMHVPNMDTMLAVQSFALQLKGNLDFNTDSYQNSLLHSGNVELVAKDCATGMAVLDHLNSTSQFFGHFINNSITRNEPDCPYMWTDENAAVDYAKGDGASYTWAVIVLNEVDVPTANFDYVIRLNYTAAPNTRETQDKFQNGLGKQRALQYINSGFTTLQAALDNYMIGEVNATLADETVEATPVSLADNLLYFPMPTWKYTDSQFLDRAGNMIPLVLALAFLYPVSRLVGGIVEEKEHRLREGMLIMGLSKTSFYLSWFCTYWILFTISSLLITLAGCGTFLSSTSPVLVFLLVELYAMSIIAVSLLLSVFFSKSRIAAIVSPLITFAMVVPKFNIPDTADQNTKVTASLSSAVAFGYSISLVTDYEKQGSGSNFGDFTADEYSYALAVWMMVFDTFLYLLLAWYLDSVLPSQYGVKLHPLFFLYPSYWGLTKTGKYGRQADNHDLTPPSRLPHYVDTEIDESTRRDLEERERVRIMGMRMEFASPDGKGPKNVAVNNLGNGVPSGAAGGADALTFYEGQVQCVLGHNGAGKTSLINMLTGMYAPTGGDCTVWGRSIVDEMDEVRSSIGLCPQHNILWARMSCEEHLMFYGRLKGVPTEVLRQRVADMLKLVSLFDKKDAWSEVLSGGQKRKLSVACALIGGSRLIFLDEPTAGMDVESRRAMWRLLRDPAVLRGRVIVLTTHYMEEADLLGDSVAIMHKGCLHSWGSSFYLKSRLGVGYNMSVAMRAQCVPEQVEEVVRRYITRAEVGRLSCTGNELRLRLPMDSLPDDEWLSVARNKLRLENTTDPAKMREAATAVIHERLASPEVLADCEALLSHIRTVSHFPDMFDELERRKDELHVESFGVGVTTLEEVFMRIALEEAEEEEAEEGNPLVQLNQPEEKSMATLKGGVPVRTPSPVTPPASHKVKMEYNFGDLYTITDQVEPPTQGTALYIDQFWGMFVKRARCSRRDKRTICFQFVLPVVFIVLALYLGSLGPPSQPDLTLSPEDALGKGDYDLYYEAPADKQALFTPQMMTGFTSITDAAQFGAVGFVGLSEYLFGTYMRDADIKRQVAFSYDNSHPVVFANATYIHSFATGVNSLDQARLRVLKPDAKLQAHNHPLPFSDYEKDVIDSVMIVITGIFIMIPFTFIPSNFVSFVVKERECKAKHVQVVSGAHLAAYWLSSFLFDFIAYCVTMVLAFLIFFIAKRDEFVGSGEVFFATLLLLLFYGIAAIASSYFLSFLFASHTSAQNAVMAFNFICGFILVIVTSILGFIDSTKDVANGLKWAFRIIPAYSLGEGIISLSSRQLGESTGTDTKGPFDMDIVGYSLVYMSAVTPVFLLGVLIIESPVARLWLRRLRGAAKPAEEQQPLLGSVRSKDVYDPEEYAVLERDGPEVMYRRGAWLMCKSGGGSVYYFNEATGESKLNDKDTPFYRDQDVQRHAEEVLATEKGRDGDYVTVKQLRKVWAPRGNAQKKVAVADLSFGVKSGELFAFLGTNGAGKTTTLSVLSGEFEPTSGQAFIAGHDVVEDGQLARQNLGFCPQFDALLDHLTCEEHLELFACLRGIPKPHRKPSAELLLGGLGLAPHRKKLASNLSGGNRRKLSVAVALMGGPSAVFLDEPSAGMDPLARRSLWGALEKAITDLKLSVILTTHHLEEIEGLGRLDHRVTIMVDGRLQCLGSLGHLKHQLGDAFELTLKVKSVDAEAALRDFMKEQWPKCELSESTQQRLSYQVAKEEASLSQMFRLIEDNRDRLGITDYSINETSLEQVFMRIGERAMREEDVQAYQSSVNVHRPCPPPQA